MKFDKGHLLGLALFAVAAAVLLSRQAQGATIIPVSPLAGALLYTNSPDAAR